MSRKRPLLSSDVEDYDEDRSLKSILMNNYFVVLEVVTQMHDLMMLMISYLPTIHIDVLPR